MKFILIFCDLVKLTQNKKEENIPQREQEVDMREKNLDGSKGTLKECKKECDLIEQDKASENTYKSSKSSSKECVRHLHFQRYFYN